MSTETRTSHSQLYSVVRRLEDNISQVVLGKRDVARMCLTALLAGEHVLLEDVPGVGKTLMGKALSQSVAGKFCRIQFTPDLLPSDILGSTVYNASSGEFSFNRGPIFCNFVLADEINRAPPRTQSALLEAMSDRQVSVDGRTHRLPDPFMVIATQNPFEFEGTYVLPESQLDRFLIRISVGYPDRRFEEEILRTHRSGEPIEQLAAVATNNDLAEVKRAVRDVRLDDSISRYMLDIVHATRESPELSVGASTRGILLWYRAVQAFAFVEGRDYVVPDDVKSLAVPVLAHRVLTKSYAYENQRSLSEAVIRRILAEIAAPG
jgi:MoxR-like ATPase